MAQRSRDRAAVSDHRAHRLTLNPGAETTADKEQNAANLAEGKQRQRLASLIQFSLPGAPTVYYGDEAGLTGLAVRLIR